jgi:hypothetical protein
MQFLLRHWRVTLPVTVGLVGVLVWLVFGFFAFHLVFVDDKVDEAAPVFAGAPPASTSAPSDPTSPAAPPAPDVSPTTADRAATTDVTSPPRTTPRRTTPRPSDPAPVSTPPPAPTTPPPPVVRTIASGEFVSRDHETSGRTIVLNDGSAQRFLRFEDFATENGPDLNVYVVVPDGAGGFSEYVDLGNLTGNIGNQNYEIPTDVDLQRFNTVVIWCVRFSSPFGEATLA